MTNDNQAPPKKLMSFSVNYRIDEKNTIENPIPGFSIIALYQDRGGNPDDNAYTFFHFETWDQALTWCHQNIIGEALQPQGEPCQLH